MKLVWKIVAIVAAVLLLIGIALIAVGVFTGGGLDSIRGNVLLTKVTADYEDEMPTELRVSGNGAHVTILPGDGLRVSAENVPENGFVCTLEDGVLTVRENWSSSWSDNFARLLSLRDKPAAIVITLPEGLLLSGADIELSAGEANITGLNTRYLKLDMNAGTLNAENVTAGNAELELNAGNARIEALTADELELDMRAGELSLTGSITGDCSVDTAAGTVKMSLAGSAEDYTAEIEAGAGEIRYDGRSYTMEERRVGKGAGEMELQSAAGTISVTFAG